MWFKKKPSQQKLLPAATGDGRPIHRETAEETLGVFVSDNNGYPVFTDYWVNDPTRRRDTVRTERTVAVHWWRPDLAEALEFTDDFSLLSLAVPKDTEEFDHQQQSVQLGTAQHRLWQAAMKNWAFPTADLPFGRTSMIWARADRMIPENRFQGTASCYGVIPKFPEVSSLIHSALSGTAVKFVGTTSHGNPLTKHFGRIEWGHNNGNGPQDDTYDLTGDQQWGIWVVKVSLPQLQRLMMLPYDVLVHVMKENTPSQPTPEVEQGKKSDFFASVFLRVAETEPGELKKIGKILKSIAPANKRMRGQSLAEAFQAFVPGSPPPKNHHYLRFSLANNEWRPFLAELVRHNSIAHSTAGGVMMGKYANVRENKDGSITLLDADGPNVFMNFDDVTSLGIIGVSGEGKTTYDLAIFLQRFGPYAIIINAAPGVNEAAEFLVRRFDPLNADLHLKVLSFDESKDKESDVRGGAQQYADELVEQIQLTGKFPASPLYITPSNRSPLAHTWIAEFLSHFRQAWASLSQVEDPGTGTKGGLLAGETLGVMVDNVSAAKSHGELLLELEDLANNGKNNRVCSDHLSHTEEGLPQSYVGALAYRLRVWRFDDLFIYRLFRPDGTPVSPYINGTLPVYLREWFARRNHRSTSQK